MENNDNIELTDEEISKGYESDSPWGHDLGGEA